MELNLVKPNGLSGIKRSPLAKPFQGATNSDIANEKNHPIQEQFLSIEKIKAIIIVLTTQYALTKKISYAQAVYHNLCTLTERYANNPEQHFLNHSLAMDWYQLAYSKLRQET